MFALIISIIAVWVRAFSFMLIKRNEWVFNRRNELNRFEDDTHVIRNYADYDTMMRKFWIWDVEKFKKLN